MKHPIKNSSRPKQRPRRETPGQLRIIGGEWRGHKLQFADVEGLRPTGDRIRETLFNWLAPEIIGAHCLDLFAGSGALGLEALSRGASEAVLIEKNSSATHLLKQNCAKVKTQKASVIQADALQWLTIAAPETPFNIVFLDPPFADDLLSHCCDLLHRPGLLASNSLIYVETDRQQSGSFTPSSWTLLREKVSGQVCYRLYHCD